jgi:hypothetical protein
MDRCDVRDATNNARRDGIENNYFAVAKVRNKQQMSARIEARVIKACGATAQRDVGYLLQWQT